MFTKRQMIPVGGSQLPNRISASPYGGRLDQNREVDNACSAKFEPWESEVETWQQGWEGQEGTVLAPPCQTPRVLQDSLTSP